MVDDPALRVVLVVVVGVLGLAIGSFLNVVVHRLPLGVSLSSPPSACPRCGTPIKARHNVPVLGWLVLRGRCHACGEPISPRYPLVEGGTGVLFTLTALRLTGGPVALLPAALWLVAAGLAAALIDLERAAVPRRLSVVSAVVLTVLGVGGALVDRDGAAAVAGAVAAVLLVLVTAAGARAAGRRVGVPELAHAAAAGLVVGLTDPLAAAVSVVLAAVLVGALLVAPGRRGVHRDRAPVVGAVLLAAVVGAV